MNVSSLMQGLCSATAAMTFTFVSATNATAKITTTAEIPDLAVGFEQKQADSTLYQTRALTQHGEPDALALSYIINRDSAYLNGEANV